MGNTTYLCSATVVAVAAVAQRLGEDQKAGHRLSGYPFVWGDSESIISAPRESSCTEQQQVRRVYDAVKRDDFAAMRSLALSRHGFCSAELRRVVWLYLLGLRPEHAVDCSWRDSLTGVEYDGKQARVIHADVERSVYSWDVHSNLKKATRDQKRIHLSEVMHATLNRHHGKLQYFQGFHDMVLVFLEVGTPAQAFHMVERLALFHLSDQLCVPFDQGLLRLLGILFFLLECLDASVAQALREAECVELHFAVPWVLTWFAHTLPRLQQVMRLFDCLLATHPAMVLYFAAALLIEHKAAILQTEREMPEMVAMLQKLPFDAVDVDQWAAHAQELARRLPPERLLRTIPPVNRTGMPRTSPLLHYPHPWMVTDRSSMMGDARKLTMMAPIYSNLSPVPSAAPDSSGVCRHFTLWSVTGAGCVVVGAWALAQSVGDSWKLP